MENVMEAPLFAQDPQPKLFSGTPLFFITNQYNLREILTGHYIGSVLSYDNKYYTDLLDLCSGRIPLFTAPLGQDVLDFVNRHDPETSFSVAVEVNPRLVNLVNQPSFNRTGHHSGTSEPSYCYAWVGVVPPAAITAVHFFTEANKVEFSLRDYSELPDSNHLYRVSPGLAGHGAELNHLTDWLESLPKSDVPSTADFIRADRASGGSVLCAQRTQDRYEKKYIEQLAAGPKQKYSLPAGRTPYWFSQGFYPRKYTHDARVVDTNRVLFSAVVSVLHEFDWSTSRRTLDILEAIERELTTWAVRDEERISFGEVFARARGYLRNERVFEPFKPVAGYEVAKALLLFLLRPDPHHLLNWSKEETGAENSVMLTAAAFSGILIGRKSLRIEFRPDALDRKAAESIVESFNSIINFSVPSSDPAPITAHEVTQIEMPPLEKSELTSQEAKINGETHAVVPISSLELNIEVADEAEVPHNESGYSDDVASVHIDTKSSGPIIKVAVGLKQQLLQADFTEDPKMKAIALKFCSESGWNNCVKSVLICPGDEDVMMKQVKLKTRKVIAFEVSGFAEVEYRLDEKQFKELLNDLKPGDKRFTKFEKELLFGSL
jgi:hypothetical protein